LFGVHDWTSVNFVVQVEHGEVELSSDECPELI
jgi:hypothetical protein